MVNIRESAFVVGASKRCGSVSQSEHVCAQGLLYVLSPLPIARFMSEKSGTPRELTQTEFCFAWLMARSVHDVV
jgi:hypothetical protein